MHFVVGAGHFQLVTVRRQLTAFGGYTSTIVSHYRSQRAKKSR
jgi:hypothetical protein